MQVYTELFGNCDKILELLVDNRHHRMMESDIYDKVDEHQRPGMRAALMHLCEAGLIKADPHPYYLLLGPGSALEAKGGYKKQFELENVDEELKDSLEAYSLQSSKSVIDTNTSIQTLNSQTLIYYKKQNELNDSFKTLNEKTIPRNNQIQWILTAAIMISTIAYSIISFKTYKLQQSTQTQQEYQQKIKSLLYTPNLSDSQFRKNVKEIVDKP